MIKTRIASTLAAAVLAAGLGACGDDDESSSEGESSSGGGSASIQEQSGSTNDLAPDERLGTSIDAPEADLEEAAKDAGCLTELDLKDEGNEHLAPGEPAPEYGTDPPTSGAHIAPPLQQADGAYSEAADDVAVVHALEHGRVAIQYSPELSEEEQLEIKGLFDEDPAGIVLFPNEAVDGVAATAWTRLMTCESYEGEGTIAALRAFSDEFRGNGPEPVPIVLE